MNRTACLQDRRIADVSECVELMEDEEFGDAEAAGADDRAGLIVCGGLLRNIVRAARSSAGHAGAGSRAERRRRSRSR